jgi:hypothetical protein
METTVLDKISHIAEEVGNSSFYEKTHILSRAQQQEIIDNFLDSINDFKSKLNYTTENVSKLVAKFEEITWYTNLAQQELKELNHLIALSKDLRSVLIRCYVEYNNYRKRGIAKDELYRFKQSIDAFTEAYKDLELIFFFLPQDQDFQEISKKISDL